VDITFNPGAGISVGACFRSCANRGPKCDRCFRIHGKESEFVKLKNKKNIIKHQTPKAGCHGKSERKSSVSSEQR